MLETAQFYECRPYAQQMSCFLDIYEQNGKNATLKMNVGSDENDTT